jgi:hypothetical protein
MRLAFPFTLPTHMITANAGAPHLRLRRQDGYPKRILCNRKVTILFATTPQRRGNGRISGGRIGASRVNEAPTLTSPTISPSGPSARRTVPLPPAFTLEFPEVKDLVHGWFTHGTWQPPCGLASKQTSHQHPFRFFFIGLVSTEGRISITRQPNCFI